MALNRDILQELEKLGGQPKVTYLHDSASHPIVERLVTVRRDVTFTLGSLDQESARWPDAKLVSAIEVDGDAQNRRWYLRYVTLDGPPLTERSVGTPSLTPEKFRRQITTTVTRQPVLPDTEPGTLSGDQTSITVTQTSLTQAEKVAVEEVIDESAEPLEGQYTDEAGIIATAESLVDEGTAAESGAMVKSSRVTPLGNGKAVKETDSYEELPTLVDELWDDQLAIPQTREREVVPVEDATEATYALVTEAGTVFALKEEFDQIDKWRSVRIRTRTQLTGAGGLVSRDPVVWYGTRQHSFPNELASISLKVDNRDAQFYTDTVVPLNKFLAMAIVTDGYSGPVKARYTEYWTSVAPVPASESPAVGVPVMPTVTTFHPQGFSGLMPTPTYLTAGLGTVALVTLPLSLPSCLHPEISLAVKGTWLFDEDDGVLIYPNNAEPDILLASLPATTPTALPHNTWILVDFDPQRVGPNLWRNVKTEIFVP